MQYLEKGAAETVSTQGRPAGLGLRLAMCVFSGHMSTLTHVGLRAGLVCAQLNSAAHGNSLCMCG
jgi:hypothetical protein